MRLFKYLVMSNDLIDPNAIYITNNKGKYEIDEQGKQISIGTREVTDKGRRVTVLDVLSISDYSNSRLVEILHNKEQKYKEDQIVGFDNIYLTKQAMPLKHLDLVKDEYRDYVKKYIKNKQLDSIRLYHFKESALVSVNDKILNKQKAENILLTDFLIKKLKSQGYIVYDENTAQVVDKRAVVICIDKKLGQFHIKRLLQLKNIRGIKKNLRLYQTYKEMKKASRQKLIVAKLGKKPVEERYFYVVKQLTEEVSEAVKILQVHEDGTFHISGEAEFSDGTSNYINPFRNNHDFLPVYMSNDEVRLLAKPVVNERYSGFICISHKENLHENLLKSFDVFLEDARKELLSNENYLSERNRIVNELNEKLMIAKFNSLFVNKRTYVKKRNIRVRDGNNLYLLKPYEDKPAVKLMEFTYSNTADKSFKNSNKAYVVIDTDNKNRMFRGGNYDRCEFFHKERYCTNGKSCVNLENIKYGETWSTINSKHSTKLVEVSSLSQKEMHPISDKRAYVTDFIEKEQLDIRKMGKGVKGVPLNTDGIITKQLKFVSDRVKGAVMTYDQWVNCGSIRGKSDKKAKSAVIHAGHTFDNRYEYIGRLSNEKIEQLKVKETEKEIYRSDYVTVGTSYFSNTIECNCSASKGEECKYCEGVLYIKTEEQLKDLYDQLTSEKYLELTRNTR